MDIKKIGDFIAERRKGLGLTQKQLADKLNMSDKSVSKWERGICLPDVSIYTELCEILGISLNEFFAGEEIKSDNIESVSEENLMKVSRDSKSKQKFLRRVIVVALVIGLVLATTMASMVWGPFLPKSEIKDLSKTKEVHDMSQISFPEGVYAFEYVKTDKYKEIRFDVTTYKKGKKVDKGHLMTINFEDLGPSKKGKFIVMPEFDRGLVKLIAITDNGSYSTHFDILEGVEHPEYFSRSADHINDTQKIVNNKETGLVALHYGEEGLRAGSLEMDEEIIEGYQNDYTYYISFKFVA